HSEQQIGPRPFGLRHRHRHGAPPPPPSALGPPPHRTQRAATATAQSVLPPPPPPHRTPPLPARKVSFGYFFFLNFSFNFELGLVIYFRNIFF
ncbi:hypothetical protein ABN235_19015, partial [Morganella morganii]|uniref:hypothetical protein n=1 Tax=Morganella morganii TaxID=582 RepID=UPI0032DA6EC6